MRLVGILLIATMLSGCVARTAVGVTVGAGKVVTKGTIGAGKVVVSGAKTVSGG